MDIYYNHDTTLDNLTDGQHTIKAYSRNALSYEMAAQPQTFTVKSNGKSGIFLQGFPNGYPSPITTSQPEPNPTATPAVPELPSAIAISILVVALVPIVFLKRRKSKTA
jgi:hypothetical protein